MAQNSLANNRFKLTDVYLFWHNGKFAIIPKSEAGRPTWAPEHEMFCDEYAFQDPALWPNSQVTRRLLQWVTLMMAWIDEADHRAIDRELCRIDEYLEITNRTHLAEEWTESVRLKLSDALFSWEDFQLRVTSRAEAEPGKLYDDPNEWHADEMTKRFLGMMIIGATVDEACAFQVYDALVNVVEFRALSYELGELSEYILDAA